MLELELGMTALAARARNAAPACAGYGEGGGGGEPARKRSMRRGCRLASARKRCAPASSYAGETTIRVSAGFCAICWKEARVSVVSA